MKTLIYQLLTHNKMKFYYVLLKIFIFNACPRKKNWERVKDYLDPLSERVLCESCKYEKILLSNS